MRLFGKEVKLKNYNNEDPKIYFGTDTGKIIDIHFHKEKLFYLVELETKEVIMVLPSHCEFINN